MLENDPYKLSVHSKALADALEIWQAGVAAALPDTIFARESSTDGRTLRLADYEFDLRGLRRIVVVGAGKASAAMAAGFYQHCLRHLENKLEIVGWINAPAGSFQTGTAGPIYLHTARPSGMNEPTAEAVQGTSQIMRLVAGCGPQDLCIVLLSGGGSAILTAPIEGITLQDKQQVARTVAAAGANIAQLNTVRRALSRVKGGGLARACRARQLITLIISDVLGDPLETIASGPTLPAAAATAQQALDVLGQLDLLASPSLSNVVEVLKRRSTQSAVAQSTSGLAPVEHIILANNATAVDAAGVKAVELGYRYIMQAARQLEGDVSQLAIKAADTIEQLGHQSQVDCWISGGEPTVKLPASEQCGLGGRNQQLMLLTMLELIERGWPEDRARFPRSILALSAGTDGEDGPTDAAGAWFDAELAKRMLQFDLRGRDFANRADAYHFFSEVGGLIHSKPTGTNVCDLRIALTTRS